MHVPQVGLVMAVALFALAIGQPKPFFFGGTQNDRFDAARPDKLRITRHPFLVALAIWVGANVPPNGDVAHVMLFGGFAVFALSGMAAINRRRQREAGREADAHLTRMRAVPLIRIGMPSN